MNKAYPREGTSGAADLGKARIVAVPVQPAIERIPGIDATAGIKVFTFPEIRAGDCRLEAGARLKVWSDGSLQWEARVMSSDTNDQWFSIANGHEGGADRPGAKLWQFNQLIFNIVSEHEWRYWRFPLAAPTSPLSHIASTWHQLSWIILRSSC